MQVTRDNHFVPQSYLRRWSQDNSHIWCYKILVPHAKVPQWKKRSVRGVAFQRDLYTSVVNGQELDEFERWIEAEFETPAQDAIERAVQGHILTASHWKRLVRYFAAQDLRTPLNYIEFVRRWHQQLPGILQRTIEKSLQKLQEARRTGQQLDLGKATGKVPFADAFKVTIDPHARPETNEGEIRVEVTVGRSAWLEEQQRLLTSTAEVLHAHKWSIAEAAPGTEFLTSDHPVVRVNYYSEGKYDLLGGWGNKGGNLLMPLSPKHLLFAEIGHSFPDRLVLTAEQTSDIQRFIAERAHRTIFANKQVPEVMRIRPRLVNYEMYWEEQEAWSNWHLDQSNPERDLEDGKK